jgi:hypothetical protein
MLLGVTVFHNNIFHNSQFATPILGFSHFLLHNNARSTQQEQKTPFSNFVILTTEGYKSYDNTTTHHHNTIQPINTDMKQSAPLLFSLFVLNLENKTRDVSALNFDELDTRCWISQPLFSATTIRRVSYVLDQ